MIFFGIFSFRIISQNQHNLCCLCPSIKKYLCVYSRFGTVEHDGPGLAARSDKNAPWFYYVASTRALSIWLVDFRQGAGPMLWMSRNIIDTFSMIVAPGSGQLSRNKGDQARAGNKTLASYLLLLRSIWMHLSYDIIVYDFSQT